MRRIWPDAFKRGIDIGRDVRRALPGYKPRVVFDIGANTGQSAKYFLGCFQGARVLCFEPVQETYLQLCKNLSGEKRASCYRIALGATNRLGLMRIDGTSDLHRLIDEKESMDGRHGHRTELVPVGTLDDFCQSNNVEQIGYLKIDTEGGDFEVLMGAGQMLAENRIDLVQVEAGMNPTNEYHVAFESFKANLERNGYLLFGIYEQVLEWARREPALRRANPVFISRKMVDAYRQSGAR